MASDQAALTLIQATGLLLPVVFLTFRFYANDIDYQPPQKQVRIFIYMVIFLTATGLFATLAVFSWPFSSDLSDIATMFLAAFFVSYGWFMISALRE